MEYMHDYRKNALFDEEISQLIRNKLNTEDFWMIRQCIIILPFGIISDVVKYIVKSRCIEI